MPNLITLKRFRRILDPTGLPAAITAMMPEDINDEITCFSSFHDAVKQLYFNYGVDPSIASIEQKRHKDGSESIALKDWSNKITLQYKTIV